MISTLTQKQTKQFGPRPINGWGNHATLTATVRYDDDCGNGYNSFSITGEINLPNKRDCEACGMLHDDIRVIFPELAPYLKWHHMSSAGPLHYIANTIYWAERGNLEYARDCAIWPEASLEDLKDEQMLRNRLPKLIEDFKSAIESLGMVF